MTAGSLTNGAENRVLDWIAGNSTTAPTTPLKLALVTVDGDDATAGTEVVGGSYARQTIALTAASSGAQSNTADITFTNMPSCTVVGAEIWDSAGTPFRWWHGPLSVQRVISAGTNFVMSAGSFQTTAD